MRFVKRCVIMGVAVLIAVVLVEGFSSAVLFRFYAHKQTAFRPKDTATGFLVRKALGLQPPGPVSSNPPWMFRPDDTLGYAQIPGVYHITQTNDDQRHDWQVTIQEPGYRVTSYRPVTASRRIYLFGNSNIWGFGLDDELTPPWLLQARLPGYQVFNKAVTGYDSVQELLQIRAMRSQIRPDDILFFSYLSEDMQANIGGSEWLRTHATGFEAALSDKAVFSKVRIPFAALTDNGALVIGRVPLFCPPNESSCSADMPRSGSSYDVTVKVFDELVHSYDCHILVGFFSGADDDPVIAHLRSSGVAIADMRIKKGAADDDDFLPERFHRGALTSYHWYDVILQTLLEHGMLAPDAVASGQ